MQDLVEKINDSRARDQTVMEGFQQELMNKVIMPVQYFCKYPRADVNLKSNDLGDRTMPRDEGKHVYSLWRQ